MHQINNILHYWKLCEMIDFERFTLSKEQITTIQHKIDNAKSSKNITEEYINKDKTKNNTSIQYKKADFYKIYYGLIESDKLIKYIYEVFAKSDKLSNTDKYEIEKELEKLKKGEFTYFAYGFANSSFYPMSIDGEAISINPIFFVLHQISNNNSFDNQEFGNFKDGINDDFADRIGIDETTPTNVYIPDLDVLIKLAGYNKNIFTFLPLDISTAKCLIDKEYESKLNKKRTEQNSRSVDKVIEDISSITKGENSKIILHKIDYESLIEYANDLANKRKYTNIHLITNDKIEPDSNNIQIATNLYLHTYINKKDFHLDKVQISKTKLDKSDKIFDDLIKKLKLDKSLFYQEDGNYCFAKKIKDQSINIVEQLLELQMTSFYINSLEERPRKITAKYIKGIEEKIDVNSNIDIRKEINTLENFSAVKAKWITPHPLYYAQQGAVNLFISKLNKEENNLLSINGAPGTGKTTLLKDIVANITTQKILTCKKLNFDIFINELLKPELCSKFEIIVTSNNNAAVENISKELPKQEEIDFEYLNFKPSDFLLYEASKKFYDMEDSYTLIATALGKQENIDKFKSRFNSMVDFINKSIPDDLDNRLKELSQKLDSLQKYLDSEEKNFYKLENYQQSINKLEELYQNKNQLIHKIANLKNSKNTLEQNIEDINRKIESIKKQLSIKKDELSIIKKEIENFGFFRSYINRKLYKEKKDQEITVEKELLSNRKNIDNLENQREFFENQLKECNSNLSKTQINLRRQNDVINNLQRTIEYTKNELRSINYNLCNDTFFSKEEKDIQKSAIYAKPNYLKAKAEVFKVSLQLNEILFIKNIDKFSSQINYFIDNINKKEMTDDELKQFKNGFSCLSFLIPVVSTTLASSYKMFKKIDSYGTLLCDESGQATPQSLVGLLNRANNALIVGDPLQVEPVFTAPEILVNILANAYQIEKIHNPLTSSAQQLADNANQYGSYYKVNSDDIWVGLPLVVHRRCVEPMFSISNKISYNDKMVLATPPLKDDDELSYLPKSQWIDVKSNDGDFEGNTSLREFEFFEKFVNKYSIENYYLISPFRSIYNLYSKIPQNCEYGTIHTFQGKESDVVFLLLGGKNNAKYWVSSKPNILNVAVTRAKKRIYIIGDKDLWEDHKYFDSAIEILDAHVQSD